ncbi:universal stress protein, partial [Paraburkholderia nemoris]
MYQQILVAVDGSETSARALDAALQLARDSGA